jgi:hypothetical protein
LCLLAGKTGGSSTGNNGEIINSSVLRMPIREKPTCLFAAANFVVGGRNVSRFITGPTIDEFRTTWGHASKKKFGPYIAGKSEESGVPRKVNADYAISLWSFVLCHL